MIFSFKISKKVAVLLNRCIGCKQLYTVVTVVMVVTVIIVVIAICMRK